MEKICLNCDKTFFDNSKRKKALSCCRKCSYELAVKKRIENGSYKRSKEQNEKLSNTIKKLHKEKKLLLSDDKRKKLSALMKERLKSTDYKNKVKETSLLKYGTEHYTQSKIVKEKQIEKFIENYGVTHPNKNKKIINKILRTKKEKGIIKTFDGITMKEWANKIGISYSYFKEIVNKKGFEEAKRLCLEKTYPETIIENLLNNINVDHIYDTTKFLNYRPDFLIEKQKLIIEIDGLYWHCDKIQKNRFYHKNKKDFFKNLGYDILFFRSNEIEEKKDIVNSIIKNKLSITDNKVFARKCNICTLNKLDAKNFFTSNHLMGAGKGTTYALIYNNNIVAAMQISWTNKKNKEIEISRFCNVLNTNVVGGFTKLLNLFEKNLKPDIIKTYIDCRYGNGDYLKKFNFIENNNDISFMWTNGKNCFHRMKYKNNSGYKMGLNKIWDCGQKKYIKNLRKHE